MKKLFISLLIIVALSAAAYAQGSGGVSITLFPAVAEYAVNPGDSIEATLRLENSEPAPLPVQISANSLLPFDEVTSSDDIERYDASSWFEITEAQSVLPSNEVVELNYKINIPDNAAPGGHYAQITVRQLRVSTQRPDNTVAEIIPEVNASILITVAGDIRESLELNTDNLVGGRIDKGGIQNFQFTIANQGNVHALPVVRLDIINGDGAVIDAVNYQPRLILPGTTRSFETEWPTDIEYGGYSAKVTVEYGTPKQVIESPAREFNVTPNIWLMITAVVGGGLLILMIIRWRQIPRAVSVLKGRAAGVAGSYKRSGGSSELDEDDGDYSEVVKELDRQKPILGLPQEEKVILADEATEKAAKQTAKEEVKKREEAKTQELIAEEIKRDAQISEEFHADTNSKTVIIQTGASTIVREEPVQPSVDIGQKEPSVTKIMVLDHEDEKTTAKPKAKSKSKKKITKAPIKKGPSKKKSPQKKSSKNRPKPTAKKKTAGSKTKKKKSK